MDIHFVKLHSSGRDYLLLDGFKNIPPGNGDLKTLAPMIINRHRGVGGYAFLVLHRGSHSPIAATMFEGDGEARDPSPDALLCVGRYAFDAGLLGKEQSWIETRERTATIRAIDSRNISVNIGSPFHWDNLQELREEPGLDIDQSMRIKEKSYVFTPMALHGYHAVIFAFESRLNLATMGRRCSRHKGFPLQPQVEIVRVFSADELEMRSWYPLLGEVPSSGSGSGAALVAAVIHGFSDREAFVHNRGGDLFIRWDESSNQIQVTGAVEYSFTGTYYWEPAGYTHGDSPTDPTGSTRGDSYEDPLSDSCGDT